MEYFPWLGDEDREELEKTEVEQTASRNKRLCCPGPLIGSEKYAMEAAGRIILVMSWQKLCILPKVKWKVEDVPNELGNQDKEIPRQLEVLPGFILLIAKLERRGRDIEVLMNREEPELRELGNWLFLQMANDSIISEITSEQNQIRGIAGVFSHLSLQVRLHPQGQPVMFARTLRQRQAAKLCLDSPSCSETMSVVLSCEILG